MTRVGDLANQVAEQLQVDHYAEIEASGKPLVELDSVMEKEAKRSVFSKITFKWRPDDEKILEQIRAGVDRLFGEMFEEAIFIMDDLYNEMRIPETVEGVVQYDGAGRIIWQKDSRGREIEDWGQLTGQDLEKTLLDLTRLKLLLAPQANDLLLEAVFAKHIFDDKAHDAYRKVMDGTIKDREAYAAQESRADKYHAFFKFYLYSHAEAFLKELNNFARILERIRYWRIDDSGKGSS